MTACEKYGLELYNSFYNIGQNNAVFSFRCGSPPRIQLESENLLTIATHSNVSEIG